MKILKGRESAREIVMEIRTETTMMHHDGGTKFYEVIRIFNNDGKRFVVVNRWGKTSEKRGGQSKVESFGTASAAETSASRKINEKRKRDYIDVGVSGEAVLPRTFDADLARLKLNERFSDSDTVESIMHHLALSDVLTASTSDLKHLFGDDDIVVEEPAPEPVRGDEWASW